MAKELQRAFGSLVVRTIDKGKRTAEFVAATQNAVETFFGREYLRMSGANMDRYTRNPVVLDAHQRNSARDVIGRATVAVAGAEMVATIEFAKSAAAEEIWQLVQDGFLRALSVGFLPNEAAVTQLGEGQVDGGFTGPARVVNEWELFEISVVPVPADAAALARNWGSKKKEPAVDKDKEKEEENKGKKGAGDTPPKTPANEEMRESAERAELTQRIWKARSSAVRELTPRGMEADADLMLLDETLTVEQIRSKLQEIASKRAQGVGTPASGSDSDKGKADADEGGDMALKMRAAFGVE